MAVLAEAHGAFSADRSNKDARGLDSVLPRRSVLFEGSFVLMVM